MTANLIYYYLFETAFATEAQKPFQYWFLVVPIGLQLLIWKLIKST